jgi:uncharacterized protein (DUF4213/DUF364 family)
MESIYTTILESLEDRNLSKVQIGLHWTAVVAEKNDVYQCGLSSTLTGSHDHSGEPDIPDPGQLEQLSGLELAGWIQSDIPLRRSLGCAAINALLPRDSSCWVNQNAEEEILRQGRGKKVVLIGHFPFARRLRVELNDFEVLELRPSGEDLPASQAPSQLADADVIAITGMTFINNTLETLLTYCKPDAFLLMLGPSTPLTPIMYDFGFNVLAGSIVEKIPAVLSAVAQGANFRQVHRTGVRLITQAAE